MKIAEDFKSEAQEIGPAALRAGLRPKTHAHNCEQELLMSLLASISG